MCSRCGVVKSIKEFSPVKTPKTPKCCKFSSRCKKCSAENGARRYWANPKKYRIAMRICIRNDPEKHRERNRRWYKNHPEKARKMNRRWCKKNPEKRRKTHNRSKMKICSTICGKLNHTISTLMLQALRKNKAGRHWETLVGYTVNDLKKHLESQFKPGMSWENHGRLGWHIDHIIPKSFFQYDKPEDQEFQYCWSLDNLQPLWAKDNLIKNDKIVFGIGL